MKSRFEMARRVIVSALALTLAACAGKEGATGPAGPTGPVGATGATGPIGPIGLPGQTKLSYTTATDSSGTAVVDLPAAAGSMTNPPVFQCYLQDADATGANIWVQAGVGVEATTTCNLGWLVSTGSPLKVTVHSAAWAFQPVAVIVIY